jgi:hypothetical protein
MESLRPLGIELTERLLAALQADKREIQAFGKGAVVGVDGELEHAAVWHAPGGAGLKSVLGAKGFVTAGQLMGTGGRIHARLGGLTAAQAEAGEGPKT